LVLNVLYIKMIHGMWILSMSLGINLNICWQTNVTYLYNWVT